MEFKEFGLEEELLDSLESMGFETATPIQEQAIPIILERQDLLACAQTGTGKTGAFVIPVIDLLLKNPSDETKVLILVPTRELALQIDQQITAFSYFSNISSAPVYGGGGGDDWTRQKKALDSKSNIIVATPGKLISFMHSETLATKSIKHLILDEADRMLDIGFYEDIISIIKKLPTDRQTLLFSATMPSKIKKLSNLILRNPKDINLGIAKPAAGVMQIAYLAYDRQKIPLITKLIDDKPNYKSILIFGSTKKKVSEIVSALRKKNLNAESISSDLEQKEREEVLRGFTAKRVRILVATDVISRGIDIKDINLVINYDVPSDAEAYVHRIGRTARADTTGIAMTLISEEGMQDFQKIERLIEMEVMKLSVPPEFGSSPEWNTKHRRNKRNFSSNRPHKKNFNKNRKKH